MEIDSTKYCAYLNQGCMHRGYKCSECPLTNVWCDEVEEIVDYLNSIPRVVMNQTGNNNMQIAHVENLRM